MKLEGRYEFEAPRSLVWEMLHNPETLARTMPGCQKLEKIGDDTFEGKMKIKMGPIQGTFKGTVKLSDIREPNDYRMEVHGRGPAGMIDGSGIVRLDANGEHTILTYDGDANVSGKIASVGQRMMDSSARAITAQGLDNLDKQIQARLSPAVAIEAEAATSTTSSVDRSEDLAVASASQTEFVVGMAKEIFNEFIPKEMQPLVLAGFGLLISALIFNWWTNIIVRRVARHLQE